MDTLTITEELLKLDNQTLAARIPGLFAQAATVQETLLKQIVAANASCEWGQKHQFDQIKSLEDYRRQVPITTWADIEPYSDRLVKGENGLLFCEPVKQFVITSGSTGKGKYIPESRMSEVARGLVLRLRQLFDAKAVPEFMALLKQADKKAIPGKLLSLANVRVEKSTTPNGVPLVYASGQTMAQSKLDAFLAFPPAIHWVTNNNAKDYLIMRFAIEHPEVWVISGNNASRLSYLIRFAEAHCEELLQDIEHGTLTHAGELEDSIREKLQPYLAPNPERAAALRLALAEGKPFNPTTYWPNLKLGLFWLSASVGRFVNEIRPLLPATTRFMDVGYGASEAKFNLPMVPEDPAGALSIATTFFEFLPVEGGEPLLAHELEEGKQYVLIITTWGGLYRYNMQDIVVCKGFVGTTPKIEFVAKNIEVINLCDEKVYPNSIVRSAELALATHGLSLKQVQAYGDANLRYYHLYIETAEEADNLDHEAFEAEVHQRLREEAEGYQIFTTNQVLQPLKVTWMKRGWQESLIQERIANGVSRTQIKLPVVINRRPQETWFKR